MAAKKKAAAKKAPRKKMEDRSVVFHVEPKQPEPKRVLGKKEAIRLAGGDKVKAFQLMEEGGNV